MRGDAVCVCVCVCVCVSKDKEFHVPAKDCIVSWALTSCILAKQPEAPGLHTHCGNLQTEEPAALACLRSRAVLQ